MTESRGVITYSDQCSRGLANQALNGMITKGWGPSAAPVYPQIVIAAPVPAPWMTQKRSERSWLAKVTEPLGNKRSIPQTMMAIPKKLSHATKNVGAQRRKERHVVVPNSEPILGISTRLPSSTRLTQALTASAQASTFIIHVNITLMVGKKGEASRSLAVPGHPGSAAADFRLRHAPGMAAGENGAAGED